MKGFHLVALIGAALALAGPVAAAGPIGPPVDTAGGGWVPSCTHPYHRASLNSGDPATACGWVAAPRRFAYCLDYPGGVGIQLTCYSPVSGWVVNIPAREPPGRRPSAHRVAATVGLSTPAVALRPGYTWYDSEPERTAEAICVAAKRFFRCDLGDEGVWFKPNGTFVLYRHLFDPNTLAPTGTALLYGSR